MQLSGTVHWWCSYISGDFVQMHGAGLVRRHSQWRLFLLLCLSSGLPWQGGRRPGASVTFPDSEEITLMWHK